MRVSDRRLTICAALTGVALVAVIGTGAVIGSSATATELTPRIDAALVAAGLEDVEAQVRGREVTVRGGTQGELGEALDATRAVTGVRSAAVDDSPGAVEVIDMTRPYLKLRRDPDRLRILGAVPDAATAATVKSSAARAFGVPVRGDLMIDPTLPAVDWTDELPAAFGDLVGVTDMVLTIDGEVLELDGWIGTSVERREVLGLVADAVPSLVLASSVRIDREGA